VAVSQSRVRSLFLAAGLSFAVHNPTAYAASYSVLYSFTGNSTGAGLVAIGNTLYGTTSAEVFSITTAGVYKVIHTFGTGEGSSPAALIHFGNTLYGSCTQCGSHENGTIYSVTTKGKLTTLFSYNGKNGTENPASPLLKLGGSLYALAGSGGGSYEEGTVISMTLSGLQNWVYDFNTVGNALGPVGGLTELGGRLFGTSTVGGTEGNGAVYSLTTTGREHLVYSFLDDSDGGFPLAGLINVGKLLYGTTDENGGSACDGYGCGTVFSVTPAGKEAVIYQFKGGDDGSFPQTGLTYTNGTFYGTTQEGGGTGCGGHGCGTIFSLTPSGAETVLYAFIGISNFSSAYPSSLISVGGALYGTTPVGGANNSGMVFKVVP
jgi:uncharacterized repeat protein (TIGR03803 family)